MKLPRLLSLRSLFDSPLKWLRWCIAIAAICITVSIENLPSGKYSWFANEWLRDQFILLQADDKPETRFVVVDIDEASLAQIGRWPWPRAQLADMVEQILGPYAAKGVALDMLLSEPADEAGDKRLAMMSRFGPLVLAQAFDYDGNLPLRVGQLIAPRNAKVRPNYVLASGYIANNARLTHADAKAGNIGFVPDKDGMIRRLPLYTRYEQNLYPGLTLSLMQCCHNQWAPPFQLQANQSGFWRIPYQKNWSAYTVIPASYILQQKIPSGMLENRLVLIGSSALGLSDRVATPLSPNSSGLLVHAAALSSMLDLQAGQAPTPWPGSWIAYLYSVILVAVSAWLFLHRSAIANTLFLVLASLLWLGMAFVIHQHDAEFSVTAPLISNLFLLAVAIPLNWQVSQRMSRRLLGTLRLYVAPAVVDELLRSNLTDPLAPAHRHVTTLIADMEGYTTQVETLKAEEAAQLTRDFLACLTGPVLDKRGTLDKYTGDGLVAFWGAPLPIENHADLAIEAAQEIVQRVRAFSAQRILEGKSSVRVRIGIESGEAMAGDFGSAQRSIYTAVGDSVNVASRLEQVARDYPYDIIIGQGAKSLVKQQSLILLGEVMLRGKEKATTIYSLPDAISTTKATA